MIFIVSLLLRSPQKGKKKSAPVSPQPPRVPKPKSPPYTPEFSQSKMQNFETNSPKNESYFTYETLEPESFGPPEGDTTFHDSLGENNQQIIENEQQNNSNLKFDDEEIKKGIIYSIILKRPDF